jgi:hypothetical protein
MAEINPIEEFVPENVALRFSAARSPSACGRCSVGAPSASARLSTNSATPSVIGCPNCKRGPLPIGPRHNRRQSRVIFHDPQKRNAAPAKDGASVIFRLDDERAKFTKIFGASQG